MKNSKGNPGFDVPVNIVDSSDLKHALLVRIRDAVIKVCPDKPDKTKEYHLVDAVTCLDHLEEIRKGEEKYSLEEITLLNKRAQRIADLEEVNSKLSETIDDLISKNERLNEQIEKYEAELVTLKILQED
jgi:dynactin complex subunit